VRNEPFVLGPTMNWPKLHFVHHERTRQIIKHAHKKASCLQKAKSNGEESAVVTVTK